MKISTDNLQNRPLVDFRWGFWVEFCLIFCKMVVKIGRARIYATLGGYCIGCEGVGAHRDVVSRDVAVGAW